MDESRRNRYLDKITHIEKRISEFNSWKFEFFSDERTKLACYKIIQEIIEGCMDLVSMMLKDEGIVPKDDYTNIELLKEENIISGETAASLKELNGLRNRMVHEYNGLSDEIAYSSVEELLPVVEEFLSVVKKWLEKRI
ncbi:MAG: DUF86 domain-containing protein [Candidatus Micrarchaeota archaeon]|nr:DUF86 domain-containing protein [Candidatus Micrarchaeota archaeon]